MASSLVQPSIITIPFADSGSKRIIPTASQIGITDGAASYEDGFPPLTMTPLASGGVPPAGIDFNGIFNAITGHVRFLNGGGQSTFDSALSAEIGGYPVGAVLQDNSGENSYVNIVDGNTTDFNSTPASIGVSWIPFGGSDFINSRPGVTYAASDWAHLDKNAGLKIQWGLGSVISGTASITFPLAFSSSVFSVTCMINNANSTGSWGVVELGAYTTTGFTAWGSTVDSASNAAANSNFAFKWMAIGI